MWGAAEHPTHNTCAHKGSQGPPGQQTVVRGSLFRHQDFTDTVTRYVVAVGRVGVEFRPKQHMVMHMGARHWDKEF